MKHSPLIDHSITYSVFTFLLFFISFSLGLKGQEIPNTVESKGYKVYHFAEPFDSPDFPFSQVVINDSTPQWAKLLYSSSPNLDTITTLYNEWRIYHPTVKNNHTRNYRKLSGYINEFYELTEDGNPRVIGDGEFKQKQKRLRKIRNTQSTNRIDKSSSNNTTWELLGPTNMKWNSGANSNAHINIYAISQSRSEPTILYSTSETGGTVFKTVDKGNNWFSVSDDLITDMGPREIEVAPTDPDIVYLGTKHDIFRSVTGGNQWYSVYNENSVDIRTIIIHPNDPDTIWAGGDSGILKSTDGGTTWNNVFDTDLIYDLRIKSDDSNTLYALVNNSQTLQTDFYKSVDGGLIWTKKHTGWPTEASNANKGGRMTTSDGHTDIIFAFIGADWTGVVDDKGGIKVMKSSDGGETWVTKVDYDDRGGINSGQGYYDWDIEMSDVDSNVVFLGTQSKWVTKDGFDTKDFNVGLSDLGHADVQEVLFNGDDLWVANDGGIILFGDTSFQNYEVKSNGINAMSFWSFDQGWNRDVQVGTHYHNGTSARTDSYEGGTFLNFGGAEPNFSAVSVPRGDKIWSKGYGSVNGKTLPDSITGIIQNFEYNIVPNNYRYDGSNITIHPNAMNTHFAGLNDSLMRSDDFGVSWRAVSGFEYTDEYVRIIEIPRSNPDLIFVATRRDAGGNLYRSIDEGASFNPISLPSDFSVSYVQVSVSDTDPNEIYIAGDSRLSGVDVKIYKTIDGGTNWIDLWTNKLTGYKVRKVLHVDGTDGGVYLLTTEAVFYRNNTLSDWEMLSEGLPLNARLDYIKPYYKEGKLRIATSRGVYGSKLYEEPQFRADLLQPITEKSSNICFRDTIHFDDYSILDHEGAVWSWDMPGAIAVIDADTRIPKAVYGSSGDYDVTMHVTKGGVTHSKTVEELVSISNSCDNIDTIPGSALQLPLGQQEYVGLESLDLTSNQFSFTAWVKPDSIQKAFAGIFTNGVWCAHCNDITLGLTYDYWANNLWYRWPGSTSSWAAGSNISLKEDQWSFVGFTMSPDSVSIYVNDEKWVSYITHEPATIGPLYLGKGTYSKYFNGAMDEVTMWDRTLSDDEIKELMHLTKDPNNITGLIGYFQFNDSGDFVVNKMGNFHGTLSSGSSKGMSSAPLGGGVSEQSQVNFGNNSFVNVGVDIAFGSGETGEVVVSKINLAPNILPESSIRLFDSQYWVIHDDGDNKLAERITFTLGEDLTQYDEHNAEELLLFGRGAESDTSWTFLKKASQVNASTNQVSFDSINIYSQFFILSTGAGNADCIRNVRYDYDTYLPNHTGSTTFIELGDDDVNKHISLKNGESISFMAKEYVLLKEGIGVEPGAILTIIMDDCEGTE